MSFEAKRTRLRVLEGKKNALFLRAQQMFDLIPNLSTNESVKHNFTVRYQTLAETRAQFYNIVDEINDTELEIDGEAQPNFQALSAFDDLYGAILIAYKKLETEAKPLTIQQSQGNHTQLPRIEIKKFSGKIQDWPEFRDLFQAIIISNNSLSEAQKYHYLRTSLESDALKLISSFPLSSEHFQSAWLTLEERFENKRLLAAHFFEELFPHDKPPSQQSVKGLHNFLSHFNDAVVGLNNLNIEDKSDLIILNLALRRLDSQTIKAFEKEQVNVDFPKYKDLVTFVKNQLKILELTDAECSSHTSPKSSGVDFYKIKSPKRVLITNPTQSSVQNPAVGVSNTTLHSTTAPQDTSYHTACPLCQSPHPLYKCLTFQQLNPEQRLQRVQRLRACKNCLSLSHPLDRCRSNSHCFKCNSRHHTLIHLDTKPHAKPQGENASRKPVQTLPSSAQAQTSVLTNPDEDSTPALHRDQVVILGTALVHIKGKDGSYSSVRVLIDPASTRSCISRKCASQLGLTITKKHQPFAGLGGVPVVAGCGTTTCIIKPRNRTAPLLKTDAVVIPEIIGPTPPSSLPSHVVNFYSQFLLADPRFGDSGPIDFLLGADLFLKILTSKPNNLLGRSILNTVFGAVIMGPLPTYEEQEVHNSLCTYPVEDLSSTLTRFWQIEEVPTAPLTNPEDDVCEQHFLSTHCRNSEGRYIVRLPFRETDSTFPESREVAVKRFLSLERRLTNNPVLMEQCFSFLREYADLGHMELSSQEAEYYLPYFCVHSPHSLTTPVRVVFDGSAKQSHRSINDVLYPGPKLQKEVPDILLNFRLHQYVFCCDIIKMFRQILLNEGDRKFTTILVRESPDLPLQEYRLNTVTYGLAPSPWHAQRVLIQLVQDEGKKFPLAAPVILNDTFMDDIITGGDSIEDINLISQQLVQLLRAGGFELSKWISNSPEFLSQIRSSYSSPLLIIDVQNQSCKILGIRWEPTGDNFSYQVTPPKNIKNSKRSVLSVIAGIFDPLGFISPLIFALKCFMQKLWKTGVDWDDPLSEELIAEWRKLTEELSLLSHIRIPRCILPPHYQSAHVLGFSDASERGYGCVVYLRASDGTNQPRISLLMAKSKVAPLKGSTIPRLELGGALLLARTLTALQPVLSKVNLASITLFTDSTIVLSWLHKPPHTLKMFVANRVSAILDLTTLDQWRHISSEQNPADMVSRGLDPSTMSKSQEWFQGPTWISRPPSEWPKPVWSPLSTEHLPELKGSEEILLTKEEEVPFVEWMTKYSSLEKIQRIQAYVLRFISNCRKKGRLLKDSPEIHCNSLTIQGLRDSLTNCVF